MGKKDSRYFTREFKRNAVQMITECNHKIAWTMSRADRQAVSEYLFDVAYGAGGPLENDQFHTCTRRALLWRRSATKESPVFSEDIAVSLRAWLPLRSEVPMPDV